MDQMILPTNIVQKIKKLSKDLEQVKKEIKMAVKVPKSQAWFWSKTWQRKERAADKATKAGRVRTFSSTKELIKDLHS